MPDTNLDDVPTAEAPYLDLTPNAVLDALDAVDLRGDGRLLQLNSYENRVFQVDLVDGRTLVATTELLLSRDMSYTESAALGKEQEEGFLYRAMQTDIVSQVLRRLAAVPAP